MTGTSSSFEHGDCGVFGRHEPPPLGRLGVIFSVCGIPELGARVSCLLRVGESVYASFSTTRAVSYRAPQVCW